jgi:hypothetical protein
MLERITWSLAAVGAIALSACDARVRLAEPRATSVPPTELTLTASDTGLAARAGWRPGVPGTTVWIRRDEQPTVLTYAADDHGVLELTDLPAGNYWVWAEKRLANVDQEAYASAPPALGGGLRADLGAGSRVALPMVGQENGSLVISEFYYQPLPASVFGQAGLDYQRHWYIELYNNSDSTIYLDGRIVGAGFNYHLDADLWPCSETEAFRSEARGIWSHRFQQFPGAGHDHPLAAGHAVVIAEQAIDHSQVMPGLPDLSHADFQFNWPSRALNPAVPTMLPIQLASGLMQTMFGTGPDVAFVAEAVDIAALQRMGGRYTVVDEALFPRAAILDLAVLYPDYYVRSPTGTPFCRNLVHQSLDALAAFVKPSGLYFPTTSHLMSAQRKLLPDGHLQRTRTSAADWEIRPRSPGKVP